MHKKIDIKPENYYSGFKKISLQFITAEDFKRIERTSVYLKFKKG
jgi:hypothetical protein